MASRATSCLNALLLTRMPRVPVLFLSSSRVPASTRSAASLRNIVRSLLQRSNTHQEDTLSRYRLMLFRRPVLRSELSKVDKKVIKGPTKRFFLANWSKTGQDLFFFGFSDGPLDCTLSTYVLGMRCGCVLLVRVHTSWQVVYTAGAERDVGRLIRTMYSSVIGEAAGVGAGRAYSEYLDVMLPQCHVGHSHSQSHRCQCRHRFLTCTARCHVGRG
jgi:hypothetical protein